MGAQARTWGQQIDQVRQRRNVCLMQYAELALLSGLERAFWSDESPMAGTCAAIVQRGLVSRKWQIRELPVAGFVGRANTSRGALEALRFIAKGAPVAARTTA